MAKDHLSGKLRVILHADVAGSTQLVQQDEQLAHERIQATFRRFGDTIARYHGRVQELRGDALLADFERASDAVTAALAFQANQAEQNKQIEDDIRPTVRIGIAMGEVVIADRTVTGAGVVLAQRMEQLAEPGGVCHTGAIHESLPQRMPFDYESLGEREVKGFDDPVRVYKASLAEDRDLPKPSNAFKYERKFQFWSENPITRIAIYGFVVSFGLIFYLITDHYREPLVLLMDGAHQTRVYDKEMFEAGATNADTLSDILLDLPIRTQRETISPVWHRHEEMLEFEPDLIVVHYSGFRQEDSYGPRERLKILIEFFIDEKTRFLIYSRGYNDSLRSQLDTLLTDLYQTHPGLKERIKVFGLLDYGTPRWMDPVVSSMLKLEIKKILNIR